MIRRRKLRGRSSRYPRRWPAVVGWSAGALVAGAVPLLLAYLRGHNGSTKMGEAGNAVFDTLTQTIRRVRNGESIEITHDGKPVARIVPYQEDRRAQLIAEGKLRPALRPLYPLPEPVPVTGPMTASEALEDGRGD